MRLVPGVDLLEKVLDDLLFVVAGWRVDPTVASFQFVALVNEQRDVAPSSTTSCRSLAAA